MAPDWKRYCWCGSTELQSFSPDYAYCSQCGSLVSQKGLSAEEAKVQDDKTDFYGREYWFSHQTQDFGFPDLYQRTRQDLPNRCLYWLRALLKYKLPPVKVLELGSAHGGFVALMRWAGFDGVGLELSPWIVEFAHQAFDVPMLLGEVEKQELQSESLDAIALFDVLEHLDDPIATIQHCRSLLKRNGIMIVQMPKFEEGISYATMVSQGDSFLQMMTAVEHLYLFSHRSAKEFFERLGFKTLQFEPPFFPTDMFFIASREPLTTQTDEQISKELETTASGRLIQALLDKDLERKLEVEKLSKYLQEVKDDRAKASIMLAQYQSDISTLASQLRETQSQKEQALTQIHTLHNQLAETQSQLKRSNTDVLGLQNKLQNAQSQLEEAGKQIFDVRAQILDVREQLKAAKDKTQAVRIKLQDSRDKLKQAKVAIEEMQNSKFWKLRNQWFKLKKKLGLSP